MSVSPHYAHARCTFIGEIHGYAVFFPQDSVTVEGVLQLDAKDELHGELFSVAAALLMIQNPHNKTRIWIIYTCSAKVVRLTGTLFEDLELALKSFPYTELLEGMISSVKALHEKQKEVYIFLEAAVETPDSDEFCEIVRVQAAKPGASALAAPQEDHRGHN